MLVAAAAALAVVAVVVVLLVRAQGSGDGFTSTASSLCDDARKAIEQLGDPQERGLDTLLQRVEIGERLVEDLAALQPPPEAATQERALVFSLRNYYTSLRLGYEALRDNQGSALKALDAAAKKSLADAEAAAKELGASGCVELAAA